MSYVLHFYRMTYKTYVCRNTFCSSRGMIFTENHSSGFFVFTSNIKKLSRPWRLCASSHWANHRSVSNGIDLFLPKYCVHKDTARYVLSNSQPFGLLSKILVLIWKICFEITHLLNMSYKLRHLSRNFAAEINKI